MENEKLLKEDLYRNFKDSQFQSVLKAQLRKQMIEKLQKGKQEKQNKMEQSPDQEFLTCIKASIVNDYLANEGLQYTVSVFLPELKLSKDLFSKYELIQIMNLQKQIQIDKQTSKQKSLLEEMIDQQLKKYSKERGVYETSTQTESSDQLMDLEQKLLNVDQEFNSKILKMKEYPSETLNERLEKYKKEIDKRTKAEMQAQITQIRQFEIQSLKIELEEQHRIQMEQYRHSIDKIYLEKLQKLRDREKETIETCKQKMTTIENASYQHRQKVIKDFEVIKEKEEDLRKMKALNEDTLRIERERLKASQNSVDRKLKELQNMEKELKDKYERQLAYNKTQIMREFEVEQADLHQKKMIVETDFTKIENVKLQLESMQKENSLLTNENVRLAEENQEIKDKLKKLEADTFNLRENNKMIQDTARRDQNQLQNYENQMTMFRDQISFLQHALDEQKNINEQAKSHNLDELRKLKRQLDDYQQQIQEYEERFRNLPEYPEQNPEIESSTISQNEDLQNLKNQRDQELNNLLKEPSAIIDITSKTRNQLMQQTSSIYGIQKNLQTIGQQS